MTATDHKVKPQSSKIFWTSVEFTKVAERWIQICNEKNFDPTNPKMPMSKLADLSQQVLEERLRRPLGSLTGRANLGPLLLVIDKQLSNKALIVEEQNKLDVVEPPTVDLPERTVGYSKLKFRDISSNEINTDESRPLETMLEDFAHNVASLVVNLTMEQLREGFKREFPKLNLKAQQAARIVPKILVVGPMGKQQESLELSVYGLVELRFVASDEGSRLINVRGSNCVACVMWTDFVSHSHQASVLRTFPRESVRMVSGRGLQSVKDALEEITLHVTDIL